MAVVVLSGRVGRYLPTATVHLLAPDLRAGLVTLPDMFNIGLLRGQRCH